MLSKEEITPEILKELLIYHPDTGEMFWKKRHHKWFTASDKRDPEHTCAVWNSAYSGKQAFTASMSNGYKTGTVLTHNLLAHRVAWAIYYGYWPKDYIDHINGVRHDNRISNLRDADQFVNMRNASKSKRNKSGVVGVHWHKSAEKWAASIMVDGKNKHLGLFSELDEAATARRNAEIKYGYHKNHGKSPC